MPKQDSAQLIQLREAFTAYSRSQTKANQDVFRTTYLNYIRQLSRDLSLPEKDDDITFIQGDSIHHVFNTMATELSPCYTADARNQHFPTAVLISIPYQYRKTSLEQTSPLRSNRADKNMINHTISSHTKASIAELMLFFTQTLTHRSIFIESPRSASLLPESTIPQEVNAAIKVSLAIQLREPYESYSKDYYDLLSGIEHLKEKSHSKISYLALLQSATIFPIAAQFAHLLKYQEELPSESLDTYQDAVKNEVSRYNYEENIERALCVFSPVRAQVNYQEIPDSSHQITLNITS